MSRIARAALLTLAIVPCWSSMAWAQTDADSIRALVKDGQEVVITDDQGRVIRGRISAASALTVFNSWRTAKPRMSVIPTSSGSTVPLTG